MQIFNTLSRTKETFEPLHAGKAGIYVCGPTVYNFIHIGNARPMCVFDTLRRYLEYRGYEVTYIQNFTDIDDKLINKAKSEGTTVKQVAERYINEYWTDADGLNIRRATVHPKATENIDEILNIVDTLVDNDHAYATADGDVYFRARSFAEYGKLSHQPLDDLESGARISVGEQKEDPMDFALWKAAKPGEPSWDSRYGKGRPGWHIECSAMSRRYLGKSFDIHCGGIDLVFPHHENEIAQSECCNGVMFAKYWMHNAFLNIDDHKMSKSAGNFFTVREISEKYGYEPIRFLMLNAHYRSPLNYSTEIIEQCMSALERINTCRENLEFALRSGSFGTQTQLSERAQQRREQFIAAMDDDLNTADGIAALFELVKDINTLSADSCEQSLRDAEKTVTEICGVLGICERAAQSEIPAEITSLCEQRAAARKAKDFALADKLRDEIAARGFVLEDTAAGVKISCK